MKIVIDAGHGYFTAGKRCPDDSMREWTFNSVVAKYVDELLAKYNGVETKFTHDTTGKTDVPLKTRTSTANTWGADILVSIHANAAAGTWGTAEGIETFVYSTKSTASVKLATAVQAQLIAKTGRKNRGVKTGDLHMVRESKMPAILVECGFMDNKTEAALLKTDAYRRLCAEAIVAGIVEVYGLKSKEAVDVRVDKANVVIDAIKAKDGVLIDGATYVPLREVAQHFGAEIAWDNKTKTATITTKGAR